MKNDPVSRPRLVRATPVFLVNDVARSMRWYTATLSFQADPFPETPPHQFCILRRDGVEIFLQLLEGYEKPDRYQDREGGAWSVYLSMQGVRELYSALSRMPDVPILEPLRRQPYGQLEFVIRDPDGYAIVFAEPD